MKLIKFIIFPILSTILFSCSSTKMVTRSVNYQSIRTEQYKQEIPEDAKIAVGYSITSEGDLTAVVKNLTDEIMIIDQTKSYFVNSDGLSKSYYDPTVREVSNTVTNSNSKGASVNLGAVAGAFGVGGNLGGLLNGINVGGSNTAGLSTKESTYFQDQPQISLAPKSSGAMSKTYQITGIGCTALNTLSETYADFTNKTSYCKFSVCITYSLDNGKTFDKIVTNFYVNSVLVSPVIEYGKVNDALRNILVKKTDAINEMWWLLSINNSTDLKDNICQGTLIDYR